MTLIQVNGKSSYHDILKSELLFAATILLFSVSISNYKWLINYYIRSWVKSPNQSPHGLGSLLSYEGGSGEEVLLKVIVNIPLNKLDN